MKITITRKHDFAEGKTKSMLDILIDDFGIAVSGVKAIEGNSGVFFALPSQAFDGRDGKKAYKNIVAFPEKEDYWKFQAAMKDAYSNYGSVPLPKDESISNHKDEIETTAGTSSGYSTYNDDLPF